MAVGFKTTAMDLAGPSGRHRVMQQAAMGAKEPTGKVGEGHNQDRGVLGVTDLELVTVGTRTVL